MPQERPNEPGFLLATLSPSRRQVSLAYGVIVALLLGSAVALPLKDIQLPRMDAFIPILATAIFINDLLTAALLYSQFQISRRWALLVLASGFLFSALMVIPYTLTFPGIFAPAGLLGGGLQTTPWLYFFWHAGLPLAVIAYALLKDADERVGTSHGSPTAAISLGIAVALVLVVALTLLASIGDFLLPKIMLDPVRVNLTVRTWYGGVLQTLSIAALVIMFAKRRSVLDLWLVVMSFAWVLELVLGTTFVSSRFSVGWYTSRIFSLAAAITVLLVLLSETTTLYAHLGRSVTRRRQAREMRQVAMDVMAASIAHEISQPLMSVVTNAQAATKLLTAETPDLPEVKAALADIADEGRRASTIIGDIRSMFKKDTQGRVLVDANEIVRDVFNLIDVELRMQRIATSMFLHPNLPRVVVSRGQLQQVLLNLLGNAADAMRGVNDRGRFLRVISDIAPDNASIRITVEDSGTGVDARDINRIFKPFFTTKSTGTGIGLAICRSIVQAHGGELLASANVPRGMVFQVNLPVAAT